MQLKTWHGVWLPILLSQGLKNSDSKEEKKKITKTWDHKYENENFLELVSL